MLFDGAAARDAQGLLKRWQTGRFAVRAFLTAVALGVCALLMLGGAGGFFGGVAFADAGGEGEVGVSGSCASLAAVAQSAEAAEAGCQEGVLSSTLTAVLQSGGIDLPVIPIVPEDPENPETVQRLAGDEAADTAAKIALEAFPDGCQTVVLARDDDFADALGAAGLAGTLNAPILLTNRFNLSPVVEETLSTLRATRVYIIGGTGAMKEQIKDDLRACGIAEANIERVWGETAADTSVECAKATLTIRGDAPDNCIVAMGSNFQDALSISSYAYRYGVPIMLQTTGAQRELTAEAQELLSTGALAGAHIVVVGGTGAVPADTVEGLFDTQGNKRVERISGWDGYDTSNQIAWWCLEHGMSASTVCFACGALAPKGMDALAGAALAGSRGGILLLVNQMRSATSADLDETTVTASASGGVDSEGTAAFLSAHVANVESCYVLGGTYVMSESFMTSLNSLLGQ